MTDLNERRRQRLGPPREAWLRDGSSHEQWARAMAACQSMNPGLCSRAEECARGDCFTGKKTTCPLCHGRGQVPQ